MAEKWKTEYHVMPKGGDAEAWFDNRNEAVSEADERASVYDQPYVVEAVTSYYDDRQEVYETEVDEEEEDD